MANEVLYHQTAGSIAGCCCTPILKAVLTYREAHQSSSGSMLKNRLLCSTISTNTISVGLTT